MYLTMDIDNTLFVDFVQEAESLSGAEVILRRSAWKKKNMINLVYQDGDFTRVLARVDMDTGDIYSHSGNKPQGNILRDAYHGKERLGSYGVIVNRSMATDKLNEYEMVQTFLKHKLVKMNEYSSYGCASITFQSKNGKFFVKFEGDSRAYLLQMVSQLPRGKIDPLVNGEVTKLQYERLLASAIRVYNSQFPHGKMSLETDKLVYVNQ